MPRARPWPSRSSRGRRRSCSSPPTSTGWTISTQRQLIVDDTRKNLLGQQPRAGRRQGQQTRRRRDRPGFDLAEAARRRQARGRRRQVGARRQVRQGGTREVWAPGPASRASSPRPRTCAPPWPWSPAARRRSGSSTRPTPPPTRRVKIVGTFPADSHPPIIYPAALTKAGGDEQPAPRLPQVPEQQDRQGRVREAGLQPDRPRRVLIARRCGTSRRTSWRRSS